MNMTQLLVLPIVAGSLLVLSSCCSTGEDPAPKLRSLPAFAPVPGADPAPAQAPAPPEELDAPQFADPLEGEYPK